VKIILFGATGMVGQGVLRECLLDPEIEGVLSIGRTPTGQTHEKLHEMIRKDMFITRTSKNSCAGTMRASSAWASVRWG
jgi:hypothetical protein